MESVISLVAVRFHFFRHPQPRTGKTSFYCEFYNKLIDTNYLNGSVIRNGYTREYSGTPL